MKRYLVAFVLYGRDFASEIIFADTIGDAIMQIQNDNRKVINVIPLGSLD